MSKLRLDGLQMGLAFAIVSIAFSLGCGTSEGDADTSHQATGGDKSAMGGSANSGGSGMSGGSGGAQMTGGSGGAVAGGSGGSDSLPGSGGQAEGGSSAIGNGERDQTCTQRTSNHVGGERIVLKTGVTSEGDEVFLGFHDTEKGLDCSIRQDAEGKHRCMPLTRGDKNPADAFYLDAQCEGEVDYRGICALDHDAVPVTTDACDKRRRFFALGDPLADAEVYSRNPEGVCELYGNLNHLRTIGPELDPAEFVEVEPVIWRGLGRLWAEGFQSAGGLQVMSNVFDSELGHSCEFSILSGGDEKCLPGADGVFGFTDPTCSDALVTGLDSFGTGVDECGEPVSHYAVRDTGDACSPAVSFFTIGAPYEGEHYLESSCSVAMNQSSPTFYAEPVENDAFVSAPTRHEGDGGKRLQAMYREPGDGGCFFKGWWDSELGVECTFEVSNSSEYFCLPVEDVSGLVTRLETFSDSACAVPAPIVQLDDCPGATPPLFSFVYAQQCIGGFRDVRPISPTAGVPAALFIGSNEGCASFEPDADGIYHTLGDLMPTSSFVEATLTE